MEKLTQEEIKELFEQSGYYISNYLLSKTCLGLYYLSIGKSVGQEVFSMCLDGPSGAGKTFFVDTYCKVASKILGKPVKFINFQLDAETGKSDLYEDIDVVATFEGDTSKIRIPGKIIEAFQTVNNGDYVILKMDEYDKARDSTDTFFNNCLQEGFINTIQHGDIEIKKENRGKLQVFLCKNDIRATLSEPMMRRNRIVRLEYMKPERLFIILSEFAKKEDCPEELVNLVTLIYEQIYKNSAQYIKPPSCSECQQAIMDASILMKFGGFSKNDIYTNIIEDMLKIGDDIQSFENITSRPNNKSDLYKLIKEMKKDTSVETTIDINDIIMKTIYEEKMKELEKEIQKQMAELEDKREKMEELLLKYEEKFIELEQQKQQEIKRIQLANGQLVSEASYPNVISNFGDETQFVKRGQDIFKISVSDWTDVAMIQLSNVSHYDFISQLAEFAIAGVTIYENGILIKESGVQKLIVISDLDNNGSPRYRLLSNYPVIPATYLQEIKNFFSYILKVQEWQRYQLQKVVDQSNKTRDALIQKYGLDSNPSMVYEINCLVYSDTTLDLKEERKNVYHIDAVGNMTTLDQLQDLISSASCQEVNQAVIISNEMVSEGKVKVYE